MPEITDVQIAFGKQPFYAIINIIWWLSHNGPRAKKRGKPVGVTFGEIFEGLQNFKGFMGEDSKFIESGTAAKARLGDRLELLFEKDFITREGTPKYYRYFSAGKDEHMHRLQRINNACNSYTLDQVFPKAADIHKETLGNKPEFALFGLPSTDKQILEGLQAINTILQGFEKESPTGHIAFYWGSRREDKE